MCVWEICCASWGNCPLTNNTFSIRSKRSCKQSTEATLASAARIRVAHGRCQLCHLTGNIQSSQHNSCLTATASSQLKLLFSAVDLTVLVFVSEFNNRGLFLSQALFLLRLPLTERFWDNFIFALWWSKWRNQIKAATRYSLKMHHRVHPPNTTKSNKPVVWTSVEPYKSDVWSVWLHYITLHHAVCSLRWKLPFPFVTVLKAKGTSRSLLHRKKQ